MHALARLKRACLWNLSNWLSLVKILLDGRTTLWRCGGAGAAVAGAADRRWPVGGAAMRACWAARPRWPSRRRPRSRATRRGLLNSNTHRRPRPGAHTVMPGMYSLPTWFRVDEPKP